MKNYLLSVFVFLLIFTLPFLYLMGDKESWSMWSGEVDNKEVILDNTYSFMNYDEELNFFSQEAKDHMKDVRSLYWYSIITFFTILLLSTLLTFFMKRDEINKSIVHSCKAIIITWIFLGTWALISFKTFFEVFHKTFFSGNYLFPYDSLIITLFPRVYFENRGILIGLFEIIFCLFVIYLFIEKRKK